MTRRYQRPKHPRKRGERADSSGRTCVSKKARTRCPGCGAKMKARDAACRRCGRTTALGEARKAMVAGGVTFIGKSMRPRCPRCHATSRASSRHCTTCGAALLTVVKSAAEQTRETYLAKMRQETNPELREGYWQLANPDIFGQGKRGPAA